jgi:hypothetical protein
MSMHKELGRKTLFCEGQHRMPAIAICARKRLEDREKTPGRWIYSSHACPVRNKPRLRSFAEFSARPFVNRRLAVHFAHNWANRPERFNLQGIEGGVRGATNAQDLGFYQWRLSSQWWFECASEHFRPSPDQAVAESDFHRTFLWENNCLVPVCHFRGAESFFILYLAAVRETSSMAELFPLPITFCAVA